MKKNQKDLSDNDQSAFLSIISTLKREGYDCGLGDIEHDEDWGWIILAGKNIDGVGYHLRRIKPFELKDQSQTDGAIRAQGKLRKDLVEVFPYVMKWDKNRNMKVKLLKPTFSLHER